MRNIDQSDVQATLRDMWDTRPARRREDRQIAGVASAIARRYDIDPTLVRIGFVAAALSGIGAALYIAGWVVLPEETGERFVQPPARKGIAVLGLVAAVALMFGWGFNGPGVLVGLAAIGMLFLLHRSRAGELGDARAAGWTAAADAPTTATGGPSLLKKTDPAASADTVSAPAAEPEPVPPAWDPLGAAPFAWDLPEPTPLAEPEPRRRRLPVTSVTMGLALLAAGITAVVLLLNGSLLLTNIPVVLGVLLAVVGTGLVVGAFARAGRGLIPIALLLSALTWGSLSVPVGGWDTDGVGDLRIAPQSVGQIQPVYEHGAGDVDLDLSKVDLSVLPGGDRSPVRTRIENGLGDVTVRVPANADVTVNGESGIGDIEFADQSRSGPGIEFHGTDLGADGVTSGRPLVLDIEMGAGSAEVHRG